MPQMLTINMLDKSALLVSDAEGYFNSAARNEKAGEEHAFIQDLLSASGTGRQAQTWGLAAAALGSTLGDQTVAEEARDLADRGMDLASAAEDWIDNWSAEVERNRRRRGGF